MINKIKNIVLSGIEEKVFPGCVIGIVKTNGEKSVFTFGHFTYDPDSNIIKEDSIFDVASITKSIPTSSLLLQFIDQGKLKLTDTLIDYVPEFKNSGRDTVTMFHLLTQTLDFKNLKLSKHKDKTPDQILNILFTTDFQSTPGSVYVYSNATSILLGMVVEKVSANSLDTLAQERFFNPLGMTRTTFNPQKCNRNEIVPTEIDDWRKRIIQAEVHDESAYILGKKHVVGSAGLFSTVPDLLTFLEILLHNGSLKSKTYFSKHIIEQMHANQISHLKQFTGLGWELFQPQYMGKYATPQTFGKTGFTGCMIVCDIQKEVGVVMLSNCTFPKRPSDKIAINTIRSAIVDEVFKS